jgi:hypothetical protein
MITARELIAILAVATATAACSDTVVQPVAPTLLAPLSAGKPAGQGANACYLLFEPEGSYVSDIAVAVDAKYNVGNPASVQVAGDCAGGDIGFVDDGMRITLTNTTGGGGTLSQPYFDFCGGSNFGGPPLDVTALFKPGTNSFTLTVTNDCGGFVFSTPLYLVVSQR